MTIPAEQYLFPLIYRNIFGSPKAKHVYLLTYLISQQFKRKKCKKKGDKSEKVNKVLCSRIMIF